MSLPAKIAYNPGALEKSLRYDIDKVFKSMDVVIKGLGSCPCHSGIDVVYQSELPVLGITEKFEVQPFGRRLDSRSSRISRRRIARSWSRRDLLLGA